MSIIWRGYYMDRVHIKLSPKERRELEQFCKKGVHHVRLVNRAKIILALDSSGGRKPEKQSDISARVEVSLQTIYNARKDFLAAGSVEGFLQRKKRETPPVAAKVTGEFEARVIALACSPVPSGCARWTLRLLAEKCVELEYIDAISHTRVSSLLKKHNLNPI
jgi:hypothetical protein